jgi:ubiquinol-cytochrome c reductase cytochrome b subunit
MKLAVRVWNWIEDRTGAAERFRPLLRHPVPRRARWSYVFGSATLAAFGLQVVTGIVLATVYVPSAGEAFDSLRFITEEAPLGSLIRGMHFWGASAMVILVGCHLLRVFLSGSYKFPREVNWLTGVVLLGLTLGMGFTGQLLRWDQNAVWSVVVGAEQAGRLPFIGAAAAEFLLGGATLGGATLSRFFAVHMLLLPLLILAGVGVHLALVLRHGISEPPRAGDPVDPATYRERYERLLEKDGVPFWPYAAWRDLVFAALVIAIVVALALVIGPAPLDRPPDPSLVNAHPRPDWYFWWYFALLAYLPPGLENVVIILAPLLGGAILIGVPFLAPRGERHPARRPLALAAVIFAVSVLAALTVAGKRERWSPRFDARPLTATEIGASSGPIYEGGMLFNTKRCLFCHTIEGQGGTRGPDLTLVGNRLTDEQLILRIANGAPNMPSFAGILSADELEQLVAFLGSRRSEGVTRIPEPDPQD